MKLTFKEISKKEFDESTYREIFRDEFANHCYGTISNDRINFKFSWRSELVKPLVTELTEGIVVIGIDQTFALIDFNTTVLLFVKNLMYNFCDVQMFNNRIYVCTELEVLIIYGKDYSQNEEIALPDYYERIHFVNTKAIIECMGGVLIEYETGSI